MVDQSVFGSVMFGLEGSGVKVDMKIIHMHVHAHTDVQQATSPLQHAINNQVLMSTQQKQSTPLKAHNNNI